MAQVPYDARFSDANQDTTRYVIKRNGSQAEYAPDKIRRAIILANTDEMREDERLTDDQIEQIVAIIDADVMRTPRALGVEEIQDRVEREICKRSYNVFMLFHDWRMNHTRARNKSGLDAKIEGIIDVKVHDDGTVSGSNEEVKQENSNKNPTILSVQRDYIAGEWCRHYIRDYDLPEDVVEANDQGIIHFHDMDYSPMQMTNCCLVNLNDMLQNGTMISGTMIEKPKSFSTACTVASQIAAAVASTQYGGQTMTLSHLAPFVDVSRQKIKREVEQEFESLNFDIQSNADKINSIVNKRLLKEIESGCQTIQYQLVTLHSTNGQAPFITIFMDIDEPDDEQTRDDLALIIRVMLEQRILGVKDASGQYIAPAFPKLIYALTPNNIEPGSKYYDLTRLAARCSTKRMVPDYISTKKMQELKGDTYPCMGCVDGKEVIDYKIGNTRYVESFERAWQRLSAVFSVETQSNEHDLIINPTDVTIWDSELGEYTPVKHMIRNESRDWITLKFSNGYTLQCTVDHPFETSNGLKRADELNDTDIIACDTAGHTINLAQNKYAVQAKTCRLTDIIPFTATAGKYSYDVTTQSEHFTVSGIYSHNCRSFLTPDRFTEAGAGNIANAKDYIPGKHKYYGRFNMGVVTINLPDVALSAGQNETKFWKILDERLELCHKALRWRYEHLKGTPSDVAPILWQYGAYARLKHGETIDKLLTGGYATISLGYAGLYETVMALRGVSHTTPDGRELGLAIMQRLNDKCSEWKANENIDYSLYGTPMESGTYKFAKSLQKRFGIIENVSDHNYITNSYHVNVREEIDAFDKLTKEAEFQKLSPGGAVSYVEVPNMQDNIDAVMALLHHIYDTILYAELNTKLDLCEQCGYDGEIRIVEQHGKLIWRCPKCGNTDESTLHVTRRSCGYLGSQFWNQGRTAEIKDRVLHL